MAEIKTVITGAVTMRKLVGAPTCSEVMNALRDYYGGQPTRFVVWDLTDGSLALLTSSDLQTLAEFVQQHAHARPGGKTALVAPTDLEFGMSRVLDTFAQLHDIPLEVASFRSLAEAAQWLGVGDLPVME